jgi:hypothetical protein
MATHYDTIEETIAAAERVLPGSAGPESGPWPEDGRWDVILAVGDFIETHPDAVWAFVQRWGVSPDDDLRSAVAVLLLEHLLQYHFDTMINAVEELAFADALFADTVLRCWKLGQAEEPSRAARFDALIAAIRASTS